MDSNTAAASVKEIVSHIKGLEEKILTAQKDNDLLKEQMATERAQHKTLIESLTKVHSAFSSLLCVEGKDELGDGHVRSTR
jgi:hypothetical protein